MRTFDEFLDAHADDPCGERSAEVLHFGQFRHVDPDARASVMEAGGGSCRSPSVDSAMDSQMKRELDDGLRVGLLYSLPPLAFPDPFGPVLPMH